MLTHKNTIQGLKCIFDKNALRQERIHWILRYSCAFCFIAHGVWGMIMKSAWLHFYDIWGFPPVFAMLTMPIIGSIDITMGLLILLAPLRSIMLYMAVWAVFTALMRPLAAMGWWGLFERAGNFGAPLGLLYLSGFYPGIRSWFKIKAEPILDEYRSKTLVFHLKMYTSFLLIGHGGYGAYLHKEMLIDHFRALGMTFQNIHPTVFIGIFGWFEILLGILVFFRPTRTLLFFVIVWKLSTEFLYIVHGPFLWDVFEFIERWGNYGVPFALYLMLDPRVKYPETIREPKPEKFNYVFLGLIIFILVVFVMPKDFLFHKEKNTGVFVAGVSKNLKYKDFPLEKLKEGNYIVFFRHTARVQGMRVSELQRIEGDLAVQCNFSTILSSQGLYEAELIGQKIKEMDIPLGEIVSSPLCRTIQMTEAMFGKNSYTINDKAVYIYARQAHISSADYNKGIYDLLTIAPPLGQNRFIIAHANVIRPDTLGVEVLLGEGDAAVFAPVTADDDQQSLSYLGHIRIEKFLFDY